MTCPVPRTTRPSRQARTPCADARARIDGSRVGLGGDHDHPDAHVERSEHLARGRRRPRARAAGRDSESPSSSCRSRRRASSGSARFTLPGSPPPVMCAMRVNLRRAPAAAPADTSDGPRSSTSATVRVLARKGIVDTQASCARRRSVARASSRWCAARCSRVRSSTSPSAHAIGAEDRVLVDVADDEAGQVVVRRRVDARHLGRLAADERAAVLAAARGDAGDDAFDDRRHRARRTRRSRGRRAAARPARGCRSRSDSRDRGRSCRGGPASIATLSFVPTPSALDDEHGLRHVGRDAEHAAEAAERAARAGGERRLDDVRLDAMLRVVGARRCRRRRVRSRAARSSLTPAAPPRRRRAGGSRRRARRCRPA